MPSKQQLEARISDLEQELQDADERIDQLEGTLTGIAEQADEALPEADEGD